MVYFIIGKSGSGKTHKIYQMLENSSLGEQAFLLVPEQASFEYERNMITLAPKKRCEVLSFTRLCDRVFKTYGGIAGTLLTNEEKILLMAKAVEQVSSHLLCYRKQVRNTDFYKRVLAIGSECTFKGITPAALQAAALRVPSQGLSQKLQEIALILGTYHTLVSESYQDPEERLEKAYNTLQGTDFFEGKTVFVDAFKDFTYPQKQLLYHIFTHAKEVYLTLCTDSPSKGKEYEVFENAKALLWELSSKAEELGVKVDPVPELLSENHRSSTSALKDMETILAGEDYTHSEPANEITICGCTDQYDQGNVVAATILDLVQTKGYRFGEIGVITREATHLQPLQMALSQYGIPYFSDEGTPFSAQPLAAFCRNALQILEKGWDTPTLISLIKTGITPLKEDEISLLEEYTFTWNTKGKEWLKEFTHHPSSAKQPSPAITAKLNHLRLQVVTPLLALKEACCNATHCKQFATAFYTYLQSTQVLNGVQALGARLLNGENAFLGKDLVGSPALLISLLDRMVRALGDAPITLPDFTRFLQMMLNTATMGKIPQGMNQVMLGIAGHTRPGNLRAVIVMNANTGVFPAVPASGGLLTDRDRKTLKEMDIPVSTRGRFDTVEESFLFYTTACQSSQWVMFTYLTGDNATMCAPLARILKYMPNCNHIQSHQIPLLTKACALGPALDLLTARFTQNDPFTGSLYTYFQKNHPALATTLREQTDEKSCALSPQVAQSLFGKEMFISPSGVEVYHKCQFTYLCQYGLRFKKTTPIGIDTLSRGSMVHFVLEHMIKTHGSKGLIALTTQEYQQNIHNLVVQYVEEAMGGMAEKDALFRFQLERIESLLLSLLQHMAKDLHSCLFEAKGFEYKIDHEGDMPPITFPLDNNCTLMVRGSVDRVDTYEKDGVTYFRIVDYKTGGKDFMLEDVYHGIGLQMLLYLFALEKDGASLGENRVPSGVLYFPAINKHVPHDTKNVAEELAKTMRMRGIVLDHEDVIYAMDPHKTGLYLPLYFNKDGDPTAKSALASLAFFGNIRKHIESLLTQMGNRLLSGDITCSPLDPAGNNTDACKYCDYKACCPTGAEGEHRKVASLDEKTKKSLLKGEAYHG